MNLFWFWTVITKIKSKIFLWFKYYQLKLSKREASILYKYWERVYSNWHCLVIAPNCSPNTSSNSFPKDTTLNWKSIKKKECFYYLLNKKSNHFL